MFPLYTPTSYADTKHSCASIHIGAPMSIQEPGSAGVYLLVKNCCASSRVSNPTYKVERLGSMARINTLHCMISARYWSPIPASINLYTPSALSDSKAVRAPSERKMGIQPCGLQSKSTTLQLQWSNSPVISTSQHRVVFSGSGIFISSASPNAFPSYGRCLKPAGTTQCVR